MTGVQTCALPICDYGKNASDDGEANLGPDGKQLYFTSGRSVPIRKDRTREQAAEDFKRLNLWDNGNNNVWSISLAPWLEESAGTAGAKGATHEP